MPAQLRRKLADVRRAGLAFAFEEMTLGSVSVAAPIFSSPDTVIAALALVVRASRHDVKRLAPAVRATAISLSRIVQQQGLEHAQEASGRRPKGVDRSRSMAV